MSRKARKSNTTQLEALPLEAPIRENVEMEEIPAPPPIQKTQSTINVEVCLSLFFIFFPFNALIRIVSLHHLLMGPRETKLKSCLHLIPRV